MKHNWVRSVGEFEPRCKRCGARYNPSDKECLPEKEFLAVFWYWMERIVLAIIIVGMIWAVFGCQAIYTKTPDRTTIAFSLFADIDGKLITREYILMGDIDSHTTSWGYNPFTGFNIETGE